MATCRSHRFAWYTAFTLLFFGHPLQQALAENWPQWRGPRQDGTSSEKGIPARFSQTENVLWRFPLPGPAGATPVVWGERIFLTTVDAENLDLLCLNTQGKLLWKATVGQGNRDVRGDEGNSASPSPSTDGNHVWTLMGGGELACYDMDGNEVWKFDVEDRYGRFDLQFGLTSTPVLDGDRLYLQLIHGDGKPETREALVVALDKQTGTEIWRHQRASDGSMECEHSYASPILSRHQGHELLITHGADYAVGHRLSDGAEIWRVGGLNPKNRYNPTLRFVASPASANGLIVIPSAKNGPVVAIRVGAQGQVSSAADGLMWIRPNHTPDVPSPLILDDLVYLCRENGNLLCLDAQTGSEIYHERTVSDRHRASPFYADEKIYLTARKGIVTVVQPGRKFSILAQNDMQEPTSASPIVSNGVLYLRTFQALYAIAEGGAREGS